MNTRGVREHQLLQNLRKNLECCQEAAKKPVPDYLELDEPEHLEDLTILPYGCAAPDDSGMFVYFVICCYALTTYLKYKYCIFVVI